MVTIVNSTLAGNTAQFFGATASSGTDVTLTYATVDQNGTATGPACAGQVPVGSTGSHGAQAGAEGDDAQFDLTDATLTSFGSVVALPQGGVPNCLTDGATVTSQGYNFSDDASCGFTGNADRQNAGDPGLSALGANGGYAPTQVPQLGSPLLEAIPVAQCQAGSAAGVVDDERDAPRPDAPREICGSVITSLGCDIGAVENDTFPEPLCVVQPKFTG